MYEKCEAFESVIACECANGILYWEDDILSNLDFYSEWVQKAEANFRCASLLNKVATNLAFHGFGRVAEKN